MWEEDKPDHHLSSFGLATQALLGSQGSDVTAASLLGAVLPLGVFVTYLALLRAASLSYVRWKIVTEDEKKIGNTG